MYVMRWFWWRVGASTEITAMTVSAVTAIAVQLSAGSIDWPQDWPLSPDGALTAEGRLCIVAFVSLVASVIAVFVAKRPDPEALVEFYRRVRPIGWWGPVARIAGPVKARAGLPKVCVGAASGLALVWGGMLMIGYWLLGDTTPAMVSAAACIVGAFGVLRTLPAMR